MKLEFEMKSAEELIKSRGLGEGGRVQQFVDKECIKHMRKYTPMINGKLAQAAEIGTKIGSGTIIQAAPQARYLYYGKLMVSSETGSAFARHGESKVLANPEKDLKYTKKSNKDAGKLWFERMKADHKEEILAGARKRAGGAQ